ncbi:hypothetical protein ADUPG1_010587 [Aduncisulcus paluster]|uniref:Uncharacterized protein n=1 Tax=Aduncisulcus paluster TaxID=2918883 RepID=A0ABQ5JWJ3_9EUKA|nr:hypothetical protein ADUPG1_010587 [Aduncisulcus paluster]
MDQDIKLQRALFAKKKHDMWEKAETKRILSQLRAEQWQKKRLEERKAASRKTFAETRRSLVGLAWSGHTSRLLLPAPGDAHLSAALSTSLPHTHRREFAEVSADNSRRMAAIIEASKKRQERDTQYVIELAKSKKTEEDRKKYEKQRRMEEIFNKRKAESEEREIKKQQLELLQARRLANISKREYDKQAKHKLWWREKEQQLHEQTRKPIK